MDTRIVSVAPRRRALIRHGIVAAGIVAGTAAALLANRLGWWWCTLALGVAIGLVVRRWWLTPLCLLAGAAVWFGGLVTQPQRGIDRVATVVGALVGLGPQAGRTVVAVTVVYGALLCLVGGWAGSAARSVVRLRSVRQASAGTGPAMTEPAGTGPAMTEPAGTGPAMTEPIPVLAHTSKEHTAHG